MNGTPVGRTNIEQYQEIGRIIDMTNDLESWMKKAIAEYYNIDLHRRATFEELILNNSLLNFASKTKNIIYILREEDKDNSKKKEIEEFKEDMMTIGKIRNAFAHQPINPTEWLDKDEFDYVMSGWEEDDDGNMVHNWKEPRLKQPVTAAGKPGERNTRSHFLQKFLTSHDRAIKIIQPLFCRLMDRNHASKSI